MIRSIATLASALLLAACGEQIVDTSCTAFQPITYSAARDSEDTKAQVRGHNAAWVRLCGRPPSLIQATTASSLQWSGGTSEAGIRGR